MAGEAGCEDVGDIQREGGMPTFERSMGLLL